MLQIKLRIRGWPKVFQKNKFFQFFFDEFSLYSRLKSVSSSNIKLKLYSDGNKKSFLPI